MKLFPHREFEIETSLSTDEALLRLQEITVQSSDSFTTKLFPQNKSFRGDIYNNEFELRIRGFFGESYHYRPILTGTVEETEHGSIVKGEINTSPWIKAVVFILLIMLCIFTFFDAEFLPFAPMTFLICLINFGFIYLFFNFRANRSLSILEEILQ